MTSKGAFLLGALFVLAGVANAQPAFSDSVVTVQELLKIDNAQALEKSTNDAIKAGLIQPKAPKKGEAIKEEVPLPKWTVLSVYGQEGNLVTDLQVDSAASYGARPGTSVAMCMVVAIEDKCVTLKPNKPSVRKGSCSKVCWTGNELADQLRPGQTAQGAVGVAQTAPRPGSPLPSPLPTAAMPLPAVKQ